MVTQGTLGYDPLADVAGLDAYLARLEARATVKKVRADQSANFGEFVKHLRTLYAPR